MLKNWPMPQDVKRKDWGCTKAGTSDTKLNDTMSGIDSMNGANKSKISRQTPKKFA